MSTRLLTHGMALLLTAFLLVEGPTPAGAQALSPSVIAVVDFETIVRESSAGQSLRKQIAAKRDAFQAEVAAEESELRAEEQELKQQQAVLAADVFAQKVQAFEARVAEVQKLVQSRKQSLDRAVGKGEDAIRQATIGILGEMAKERGFNIVLPLRQVLLVESTFNLTEDVMAEINRRFPDVTVEFSAE